MSCGPLTLLPGSVHFFNAAVFQTSDQGSFAKTEKLNKARLLALQKYYDKDSLPRCGQYALSTQDIEDIEKKVIVFPNPSNGNFSIKWDLMNVEVKNVSILNNIGKEVYSQEKFQGTNQINLKNMYLTSGLYFVNVNTNNGVITKKVIVK